MTPQEAKQVIENMLNLIEIPLSAEQNQALEKANEALEKQTPMNDADHCWECEGYGDDYMWDEENGEYVSFCDDCIYNDDWEDDKDEP